MSGGQGRTPDDLAESAAICAFCAGGFLFLFAAAIVLKGLGVAL